LSPEETIGHVSFEDRKSEIHEMVVQSRWNSLEDEAGIMVRDYLSFERVMDINPFEVSSIRKQEQVPFERRLRRAITWLRLDPFLERSLISLSNGERQRVQLARALCHPLRLLLLDEPYIGLDVTVRQHFHHLLERLMETSLRVLIITTRPEELPQHITHVLRIRDCQVLAAEPRGLGSSLKFRNTSAHGGAPGSASVPPASRLSVTFSKQRQKSFSSNRSLVPPSPLGRGEGSSSSYLHPPVVEMRNVTVRYGNRTILKDIDWTIRDGESWALLGPNGSGKSTLLSLILGDNPQAYMNDIVVFGRQRGAGESIWELKKQIGWVSPELQLHFDDNTTCLDAVLSGFQETIGLFEPPTKRQRSTARHWLERFELLDFAKRPLFELSAGIQRIVFLARALAKNSRLLVLDEPCQALDLAHRNLFIRTIEPLIRSRSITAIYVTHRREEIPPSIHRIKRLTVQ
jgi:molybdate transport system ATP-binding protein